MAKFSLNEISEQAGSGGVDFVKNVANKVRNGACSLYREYPAFMTNYIGIDTPISAFTRGVWESVCRDAPGGLPPAPTSDFQGGQCLDNYDVSFRYEQNSGSIINATLRNVPGKIGGIVFLTNFGGLARGFYLECGIGSPGGIVFREMVAQTIVNDADPGWIKGEPSIISITKTDGTPDNCGDKPPTYPDVQPPPGALNDDVDGDYADGSKFTFPVVYAPITPTLEIPINVGGLEFKFGVDGVEFNFGDGSPASGGQGDNPGLGDRFDDFKREWDDFIDNPPPPPPPAPDEPPPPPPNPDDYDKEEKPPEDPDKEEDNIEGLRWVVVTLTEIPKNAKKQAADGDSDVYYCGHFSWRSSGGNQVRQYLHWSKNVYYNDKFADGYSVTLYNGYKAKVEIYKDKIEDNGTV